MAEYTTQFSIGQRVWLVRHQTFYQIVKCSACSNTGSIRIGGEEFRCPKCEGRAAHTQHAGEKYYVYGSSEIGKIMLEDEPKKHYWSNEKPINPRVTYMVYSTGVGSGTIWEQEDLFETKVGAESFCEQQNGVLPAHECEMKETIY